MDELVFWTFGVFGNELAPWVIAFVFTQLIEIPIYTVWMTQWCGFGTARSLAIGFAMSAVTHPAVWFLLPKVYYSLVESYLGMNPASGSAYVGMLVVVESFAVLFEAWMLYRIGVKDSLRVSFVANMSSFGLGMLSRHYFGIP
jgi:hypothetical protein